MYRWVATVCTNDAALWTIVVTWSRNLDRSEIGLYHLTTGALHCCHISTKTNNDIGYLFFCFQVSALGLTLTPNGSHGPRNPECPTEPTEA